MAPSSFSKLSFGCGLVLLLLSSRSVFSFQTLRPCSCFTPTTVTVTSSCDGTRLTSKSTTTRKQQSIVVLYDAADDDWISLTEDHAVRKRILEKGSSGTTVVAQPGQTIEMEYVGTLGKIDWDVEGVIDCWLSEQQGLDGLADLFRQQNIDVTKLMDPTFFTEDYVTKTFGLSNKIQIKKLVMAAKSLAKSVATVAC